MNQQCNCYWLDPTDAVAYIRRHASLALPTRAIRGFALVAHAKASKLTSSLSFGYIELHDLRLQVRGVTKPPRLAVHS